MSTVRWNPKEAAGKALTRRTETAYEAAMLDERANRLKVRYLYGKHGSICGGYKREGRCTLPGEICPPVLKRTIDVERRREGHAEVSRGHSRHIDRAEGLNVKTRQSVLNFDDEGDAG